jgi:D-3-phosphoglycerate dehydrogenase
VRDTGPGDDLPVGVGDHPLDGGGANVDSGRGASAHGRRSEHDIGVTVGHYVRVPPDRPRALVTSPLRGPGFEKLQAIADVVYDPWIEQQPLRIYNAEQLAERASELSATVLVVEADSVKGPVLDLPLIAVASTRGDPNNVDIPAATAKRIPVLNAPGRNADAVAEMAVALLFALNRHIVPADADVRAGQIYRDGTIPYQRFRAWELAGRTAGLVGLGAVGRALRWRLVGLGMEVIAADPYNPEATDTLADVLARSDVVSMHAPVTPETTGMIGPDQFASMKEGAVYINTARAQLHDHDALIGALRSGHLSGAGLDHFVGEMLATDDPLCAMPNVVLTPHIGGATWDTEARQSTMIADDLARILAGEPPIHAVNPEVFS